MTLGIILLISGGAFFIVALMLWSAEILPGILGLIWAICAVLIMVVAVAQLRGNLQDRHNAILRDLTREGWNIKSSDIHVKDEEVDIASCVRLRVKKLSGKYYIVRKRTDLGGGLQVVPSSAQPKIVGACEAIG